MIAAQLRERRDALVADTTLRGRAFGHALARALDDALTGVFAQLDAPAPVAIVALGSYGRDELCPGSDVDVLLLHDVKGRRNAGAVRGLTEQCWYPLWDAGFVTGHGVRTVKESLALADEDLDALTALLDVRHVAGAEELTVELERRARELARKRSDRVLRSLSHAAALRRLRPGPIAEVLEPDLKDGAGGLRDVQALGWGGWALGDAGGPGGPQLLVQRGYLSPADLERVRNRYELLLDARVALQRATSVRSDRLVLQEQDVVAAALGATDADHLVRDIASAAREVAWIAADVWSRINDVLDPSRGAQVVVDIADGVSRRGGRVHVAVDRDGGMPALRTLEAACAAAELDLPFDRSSLARLRRTGAPVWDVWERAAFVRLLRSGARAVPVFEALDHEGVLTRLLPEWEHVRSRPQRNAYHRFTVDRHLLEAVAECAGLLDAGDAGATRTPGDEIDARIARACRRPELLLFGALLHDIAKGMPGDHAEVGEAVASTITRRMKLDSEGREVVGWLVRNHLLLADVATRRDLSDASVADNVAAECAGDPERLRLLYLLTIGDSRATGPAAWSPAKAALVRDLFVKAAAAIERGEARVLAADRRAELQVRIGADRADRFLGRVPESYLLAFTPDDMVTHEKFLAVAPNVTCDLDGNALSVIVIAPDRPGLLATLAGTLAASGIDVTEANVFGTTDGAVIDVFRGVDRFGRVDDGGARLTQTIERALAGEYDPGPRVDERRRSYASPGPAGAPARVDIHLDASDSDTVVEVHADDDVGLLFRLASAFAQLGLDVRVAKVATLGKRVVDVFYVRNGRGDKITDDAVISELHAALVAHIAG